MTEISLSKSLLVFYLFIASGFTKDLYSGQLKDFIQENRFAQHILGFISMLVIVNFLSGVNNPNQILMYSFLAYIWFILTTKLDLHWNLIIIALLVFGYLYESNLIGKEEDAATDPSLTKENIKKIKQDNKKIKKIIFASIITVTLIGTCIYLNKKTVQHGGNFDLGTFILN